MIRHIFWDWNGTLADDAALLARAVDAAMASIGRPPVAPEKLRARFTRPLSVLFERLTDGRSPGLWPAWQRAFVAAQRAEHTPPLAPDAAEALRRWNAAGRTQSILSLWPADDLAVAVGANALSVCLDGVRGSRGSEESKRDMLRQELALRELDPVEAVLIGDTDDDVAAARATGTAVIVCDAHSFAPIDRETLLLPEVSYARSLSAAVDLALALPLHGLP